MDYCLVYIMHSRYVKAPSIASPCTFDNTPHAKSLSSSSSSTGTVVPSRQPSHLANLGSYRGYIYTYIYIPPASLPRTHALPSSMSTINTQIRTSHEAASVAEQEDGRAAVVLGLAELVQHVLLGPLDGAVGELLEQLLHHLRHDVARRDGVHADVLDAPFHR